MMKSIDYKISNYCSLRIEYHVYGRSSIILIFILSLVLSDLYLEPCFLLSLILERKIKRSMGKRKGPTAGDVKVT